MILALLDARDGGHRAARLWLKEHEPKLATTPLVLAEADHLVRTHGGSTTHAAFLANVASGAFRTVWWDDAAAAAVTVTEANPDVGQVDASLVALAARLQITQIATFDERHFRAMTPL